MRVFLFLFCAFTLPALSYSKDAGFVFVSSGSAYGPGDAPWIYKAGVNGCFVYEKYIVKVSSYMDPGQDMLVYKRNNSLREGVCEVDSLPSVLTIIPKEIYGNPGVKEFTGFYGIFKNRMFVHTGTYEFERVLDVYDLDTGKIVYTSEYNHSVKKAKGWAVSFWRNKKGFKNALECPNRIICEDGGGPELEETITLNLSDFKERIIAASCYCPS